MTESRLLIELLTATDEFFKTKGIDAPRRNAEALFAKVLSLPRIELYIQHDRTLKENELTQIRELIRRRAKREPLQYLLGEVEFCGARIAMKPGLLIPRPETAELVTEVLKHISDGARVLDIGSGSGCISVALAKNCANSIITSVDIDRDAVEQTLVNASLNGLAGQVKGIEIDLFSESIVAALSAPFDVIVSNPPYLRDDELAELEPEVKDHEHKHALASGPNGDECYVRIAELLPELLKPTGLLALEFGIDQAQRLQELFTPLLSKLSIYRDMQGKERFLIGWR